jgi:hypothetical protein
MSGLDWNGSGNSVQFATFNIRVTAGPTAKKRVVSARNDALR